MTFDRVIGKAACEFDDVHVACTPTIHHFAHDAQLASRDFAGEHLRLNLGHAGHEVGRSPVARRDLDLGVDVGVPVDEVVTPPARHDIAATTAKDDVTTAEADFAHLVHAAKEGVQTVDQRHVLVKQRLLGQEVGLIVAAQEVCEGRPGQGFGVRIAVQHGCGRCCHRRRREDAVRHVGMRRGVRIRMACPVKAELAEELVRAKAADHDVVAGFGVEVVVAVAADQNVMPDDVAADAALDRQTLHDVTVIAQQQAVGSAGFQPVVAFPAHHHPAAGAATGKVVVLTQQDVVRIHPAPDEVAAGVGDDQVDALTRVDHVIASTRTHLVIAKLVRDDVVAFAAEEEVVAFAAFHAVIASVAPVGVVALAADQDVIAIRAAHDDMFGPDKAHRLADTVVVRIHTDDLGHHRGEDQVAAFGRISAAKPRVELLGLVSFDEEVRGGEHVARQVRRVGVAVDDVGKLVVFHLRRQVQVGKAGQVVEPVRVLQRLELDFEDEVEGRSQHAAEDHLLFGKAADPEVDIVQAAKAATRIGALGMQEVHTVRRR